MFIVIVAIRVVKSVTDPYLQIASLVLIGLTSNRMVPHVKPPIIQPIKPYLKHTLSTDSRIKLAGPIPLKLLECMRLCVGIDLFWEDLGSVQVISELI